MIFNVWYALVITFNMKICSDFQVNLGELYNVSQVKASTQGMRDPLGGCVAGGCGWAL